VVKRASEKSRESAGEGDGTPPCGTTHSHAYHVLFSYKALNMPSRKGFSVVEGHSGVFGVSIKSNNTFTGSS